MYICPSLCMKPQHLLVLTPSPPSFAALVETHTRKNPFKVKLLSAVAIAPTRGSQGAAGYDLYAPRAITIPGQQQVCIPLDLAFKLPVGTYDTNLPPTYEPRYNIDQGMQWNTG